MARPPPDAGRNAAGPADPFSRHTACPRQGRARTPAGVPERPPALRIVRDEDHHGPRRRRARRPSRCSASTLGRGRAGLQPRPRRRGAHPRPVSFSLFYNELRPAYGCWGACYGQVFVAAPPEELAVLLTRGRWTMTRDYGWMWVSDEPFGWRPITTARGLRPSHRLVLGAGLASGARPGSPGRIGDYLGWAHSRLVSVGFGVRRFLLSPPGHPSPRRRLVLRPDPPFRQPPSTAMSCRCANVTIVNNHTTVVNNVTNITNVTIVDNRVYNYGIPVSTVNALAETPVETVELAEAGAVGRAGGRRTYAGRRGGLSPGRDADRRRSGGAGDHRRRTDRGGERRCRRSCALPPELEIEAAAPPPESPAWPKASPTARRRTSRASR